MVMVIAMAYIVLALVTTVAVRQTMRASALDHATDIAQSIMARSLAIHAYFTEELKPAVTPLAHEAQGEEYFDARWMSSSYAVHRIQEGFGDNLDGISYYYREAAVGARNPESEADEVEAAYFSSMADGSVAPEVREVREFDGEPYFVVMQRGEVFEDACMPCHSTPDVAPAQLVATYGPTAGFNKRAGDVASVISVRVPLGEAYHAADLTALGIIVELLIVMLISFGAVYLFNRRYLLHPLDVVRDTARAVANEELPLGTRIEVDAAREVEELADAFSTMSERLAATIDTLEDRVEQRTQMLDAMNQELKAEIIEREAVQREVARYKSGLEVLVEQRTRQLEESNEQLRRATEAKSQFLANMSHELRTPLNSVIGFTDMMLQGMAGPVSDEQQRQLLMVSDAGRHLLALVNDVLDLSRVENGEVDVDVVEFDMVDEMRAVVESLASTAHERGLALQHECPSTPVIMRSDAVKVRQILLNIVSNAVKFTERGKVQIACSVSEDEVTVSVTDTGPGIPADEIPNVFAVFWQHKVGDRAKPEGAGLGLAIARRLSHLLGGGITVSSELGKGSTFTVTLPRDIPAYDSGSDDDEVLE